MAYFPARPSNFAAAASLKSVVTRALAPHWGALLALTLFLIVGLAVLDDYGVTGDESNVRLASQRVEGFLTGADGSLAATPLYVRLYNLQFSFLFAERLFGLDQDRAVYLSHKLILHCFFLGGGLFAYLLARRLFGSGVLALATLLLFLIHPRIYGHSFFNSKDVPFLSMFMVALFLTHRAFKRDTIWAFALLGAGVGILANLRIMGVILLAAIPAMRGLDLVFAQGWAERKRVLLATAAFALTATLAAYALLPYLWGDPIARAVEWWTTLSNHPNVVPQLFRGEVYLSADLPREYLPVWFSIASPPFLILLGLVGTAVVVGRVAKAPMQTLRSGASRFDALLVGCFLAPILAVVLLAPNIYGGWRQMHFLWAPFALLAAFGLRWLLSALAHRRLRAAVYAAAGMGLATTLASIALMHPNHHVYFNSLVDRVTPERLRTQYIMDYSDLAARQAFLWILNQPDSQDSPIHATTINLDYFDIESQILLPDAVEQQLRFYPSLDALNVRRVAFNASFEPPNEDSGLLLHRVKAYENTLATVERKPDLQAVREATLEREPIERSAFDVYRIDNHLALVKEPCAPSFLIEQKARLRVAAADSDDLPYWRREKGTSLIDLSLSGNGALFDGKCVALVPLPDYPDDEVKIIWAPPLLNDADAREAVRLARQEGSLLARAAWDMHLADGELTYVKEPCDPNETEPLFWLNVFPQRMNDLSEERRQPGFERFWFEFHRRGALLEEACVALFPLPNYPVAGFQTGQTLDGNDLWRAEFSANPDSYRTAYRIAAASPPLARSVFDVHLSDGALIYAKEPCEQADAAPRFFLHIAPERVSDLQGERPELGFDNLDFRFFLNGAVFDGKCAARVPLPDYPVASVRTGQFSGAGEIWSAEFGLGQPAPPAPFPEGGVSSLPQ